MTRKLLPVALVAVALAISTAAFGQTRPQGNSDQRPAQAPVRPPDPQEGVTWRPEVAGEPFTGIPGGRRVAPDVASEARVLTITDGRTGKEYRVPYTASIEAEQTPDGKLHGRISADPHSLQAAIERTVPPEELARMRRSSGPRPPG